MPTFVKQVFVEISREEDSEEIAQAAEENLQIRLFLKLTHFPCSEERLDAAVLLKSPQLRSHGQLVALKLSRVLSVFPPQFFIQSKTYKRVCDCERSHPFIYKVNDNPMKLFRNNSAGYANCLKSDFYKGILDDDSCEFCPRCNEKYLEVNKTMGNCQKVEILPLAKEKCGTTDLKEKVTTLWLLDPFVNQLEVGEVLYVSGFYFMCP
jgi:hypothetical protein